MNTPDPIEVLKGATADAFRECREDVERFGIEADPSAITRVADGWVIPVGTGVETGSAYELARILDRLQEQIESRSQLSVSLFLDPFLHKKAG